MATITSGIGLFSGLDYATLVDQLIAIDARPRDQLLRRMGNIDAQRTAFMDITARVTALLARVEALTKPSLFRAKTAVSSNTSALSVTASEDAQPGSYSFMVRALATNHQLISRGFAERDMALNAGNFSLETALAQVNRDTSLDELNGFTGVQRGSIKIIDGDGEDAVIDLYDAQTVSDVIDKINNADIGVTAKLSGEGLVLSDTTGGTLGLRVREVDDGHTAADLGFAPGNTYNAGGELTGSGIMYLADTTMLSALNDGLGIRRAIAGGDFTIQSSNPAATVTVSLNEIVTDAIRLERLNHAQGVELGTMRITTKDGIATDVDLSAAQTIGDVQQMIQDAVEDVTVVMSGSRLVITDSTGGNVNDFTIADIEGHAARDLGILGKSAEGAAKINGQQILHVDTIADVIAAINYGAGNQYVNGAPVISAAIDPSGTRMVITDNGGGTFPATVLTAKEGSQALYDLGFAPGAYGSFGGEVIGERIIGGIDSVLLKTLNGGNGFETGTIHIEANGAATDINLEGAETLRDVIEQINAAAIQFNLGIEAGYDSTGTRLQLINLQDDTAAITVSDVDGSFASSIGIQGSATRLRGDNLQRQYMSEATLLEDLNLGQGVSAGKIRITDSSGMTGVIDLTSAKNLRDVIEAINASAVLDVEARINDHGDGLLLVDNAAGSLDMKVEEENGGTTARDLNILGEATDGQLDGTYEFNFEINTGDTLDDLVSRIDATSLASASLINDGSAAAPYRLSVVSSVSGLPGELILDGFETDFDFSALTDAQDAKIVMGNNANNGVVITSSSNTITDIVDGLTLNLTATSDEPITVTVDRDMDSMISTLSGLVDDFNSIISRISELSGYNVDTETAGLLLGDSTVQTLENRLHRAFTGAIPGATGNLTRFSQLGVKVGTGGQLIFDAERFREVYEADPEEVTNFFTTAETGLAITLKEQLKQITQTGGLLDRRDNALEDQRELLGDRVERLNELLAQKRLRMLREFQMMEQALGQLQSQQAALNSFSNLLTTTS
ncbi:MAG: flagellar filament capping protein FliD [Planctomycetota bacterium]